MRCSKVRKELIAYEDSEIPAAMREHIDGCAACRAFMEKNEALRSLVSLKRFEQPDQGFDSRNLYAIRQRIAEEDQVAVAPQGWGLAWPVLRYAAVTVLVGLIAVYVFVAPPLGELQSQLPDAAEPARLAGDIQTNDPIVIRVASNASPSGIQYGTTPSAVAGYDF